MNLKYDLLKFENIKVGYINDSSLYLQDFDLLFSFIPHYYQKHILKYKNKQDQLNSLLCYLLLNNLYKKNISIEFSQNGKPYDRNKQIHFSFSHKKNKVICCIYNQEIGIDIESIIPYNEKLAKKICNDKELKLINSNNKDKFLTHIWTKKESYIKMIDLKHSFDFSKIEIDNYKYITFFIENNYYCCICYK